MSSAPYFKLYFSDLAGDTLDLSDAEIGSYVLLLGAMWNAGGALPNEPKRLARIARASARAWPKRWAALREFFIESEAEITHKRVTFEREKVSLIAQNRSAAGDASAYAKSLKSNDTGSTPVEISGQQTTQQNGHIPDTIAREEKDACALSLPGEARGEGLSEIPEGFPDAAALAEAREAVRVAGVTLDVERQAVRFRHHAKQKARRLADWREGFRGWIENAAADAPKAKPAPTPVSVPAWPGPSDLWAAVVGRMGEGWAGAYLGHCRWVDVPRGIRPRNGFAAEQIRREISPLLSKFDVRVIEEDAA